MTVVITHLRYLPNVLCKSHLPFYLLLKIKLYKIKSNRQTGILRWGTYRNNHPGGTTMQLGPSAINRQRPVVIHYIQRLLTHVGSVSWSVLKTS